MAFNVDDAFAKHWGITIAEAEERLHALYAEINRTKFNNELPEKVWIRISLEAIGRASTNPFSALGGSIFFHPFMAFPEDYREIMAHEMSHLVTYDEHGPKFQVKLKEAGQGEPWLDAQLEQCAKWMRLDRIKTGWIKHALDLLETSPSMPWIAARREIANRLGCKVREFDDNFRLCMAIGFKDYRGRVSKS